MKRFHIALVGITLILAMALQPFGPWALLSAQAQSSQPPSKPNLDSTLYMPLIMTPPGPPSFEIISPPSGGIVSGISYFAVQQTEAKTVSSVRFQAGDTDLGVDSTSQDGFKVFLDTTPFPAGLLQLTAVASGPSGEVSKSITVNVEPNPPANGAVTAQGGVFATQIGSIVNVPPGSVPAGTTVSVSEKTQEEVTADTGIQWENMGVTFLGAQVVQSGAEFSKPLGVQSAGFGNRVQPGQAVVNYRIIPDVNGDGVDEIVAVNTASVAPNNDVISDPIPQAAIAPGAAQVKTGLGPFHTLAAGVSGPPGVMLKFKASGFNPFSQYGNVAAWTSSVDGTTYDVPGLVETDPTDSSMQIFKAVIPPLPTGAATVTLHNDSTSSSVGPIAVTITTPAALPKPAGQILDEYLADTITYLDGLPAATSDQQSAIADATAALQQSRDQLAQLLSDGPNPDEQQALEAVATMIANSDLYNVSSSRNSPSGATGYSGPDAAFGDILGLLGSIVGILGALASLPFITTGFAAFAAGAALGLGVLSAAYFACKLLGGGSCFDRFFPPQNCPAAPSNSGSGTTGMGSAPPSGGNGCGSAAGGGQGTGLSAQAVDLASGRYLVKIFSGGTPIPFTGMTDSGGYFFVPLIPEGEPFTALAIDTATGKTRTLQGVGPAKGSSKYMFFNFLIEDSSGATPVNIGDVISNTISAPNEIDLYSFKAQAGQQVFFDVLSQSGISLIDWQVIDQFGNQVFRSCLGCGDPGVYTLTGGTYILTVGNSGSTATGSYQVKLWDVPLPQVFDVSVGDVISDGVPGPGAGNIESPGAKDIFHFQATPGQSVFFDTQAQSGLGLMNVSLVDSQDTQIFSTCLGCGDAGVYTLTAGGVYTLTFGELRNDEVGTYQFELWDVPPPQTFDIAIGDTISDGDPGPGAGNIETPGSMDIFHFQATAGQSVFFDSQAQTGLSLMNWSLFDSLGARLFSTCLGCGDPGVHTLTAGGVYTLTFGELRNDQVGTYQVQLWDVPPPQTFDIAIGDTVSDGVPGVGAGNIESPGVMDIYNFTASAGQTVLFDILSQSGVSLVTWKLLDPNGGQLFSKCLGCGDPGVITLTLDGEYRIEVGSPGNDGKGTYSFQLTEQP